ncbi:FAS-associated factor 2 isoform X1 [Daktulosphaira vitifoliae]|uniref:FAS-associated factor 2 isoform X1 n=1 Tax=Daktulosphaira vitifoliae TaxID=58002 RepID=UPI0021A9F3E9|nr:FAS-associated factor 2 isoform X1 [Daktulosphaira vitifoliae]XP_050534298.1 FAS-associated factor 2 isoform X1 [Daktulosphaira vitifoliae]
MENNDFTADLCANQIGKLFQFQDLTGIESLPTCRDVLQRHNWDLESAVQDQLNLREGRPSVFAGTSETSSMPTVLVDPSKQQVFNSDNSRTGNFISFVIDYIFRKFYSTFMSVVKFTWSLIWPEPRVPITDPIADVGKFIESFESLYGNEHPVFYRGSYKQALNDAKQELRFLVIYLHQNDQQQCSTFCNSVLSNNEVISFLNESNILFWACEQDTFEGGRVASTLHANAFPFIAVIVLMESRMTLAGRMEGPVSPEEFIRRLRSVFEANEPYLIAVRAERIERSFNQSLREQQDRAYLESLRADEQKEQLRREKENIEREEHLKREREEEEERTKKEELKKRKIEMMERISQEPSCEDPGSLTIVFIMPGGIRVERRFSDISPLSNVIDFVFCHPNSPDSFEIATNFPKRVLSTEERNKTLKEVGLQKREVLFINDLDS